MLRALQIRQLLARGGSWRAGSIRDWVPAHSQPVPGRWWRIVAARVSHRLRAIASLPLRAAPRGRQAPLHRCAGCVVLLCKPVWRSRHPPTHRRAQPRTSMHVADTRADAGSERTPPRFPPVGQPVREVRMLAVVVVRASRYGRLNPLAAALAPCSSLQRSARRQHGRRRLRFVVVSACTALSSFGVVRVPHRALHTHLLLPSLRRPPAGRATSCRRRPRRCPTRSSASATSLGPRFLRRPR